MADPQDRPEGESDVTPTPPAKKQPAKKAAKAPAKKAPAKKAPAKKAPAKKAPEKVPVEQAPVDNAPAATSESAPPTLADEILGVQHRAETNGQLAAAAKDAAAQAKSTVDHANDPLPRDASPSSALQSPVPLVVALALSLLAILLVRQLRRG
ncbi:nucleoid-structuring protein H-NS [Mycobacterium kubicae]|uniref:Rv3852 family protein n=1 Tax=Mycobacterium kubicae TaxID=120959 RepID=UPI0007FD076A|nr:nucleoid-structuring protein H-NS [Mycobacterium kubicae]OBF15363.1 nucleoid-structuring protein H-NS [Mycobacterium kubicae]OBK53915.1 nucleoid-structuring protein H-NS [Mycobacterium kubicae]